MPIYRFTQTAYFEQDIEAESLNEAQEIAEVEWMKRFGSDVFGDSAFEYEVTKEVHKWNIML